MNGRTDAEKCCAFLYIIGHEGRKMFNTMPIVEEDRDRVDVLFQKFKEYSVPRENITVGRYRFNTRVQMKTETIDLYVTDLRVIFKNCKFDTLEVEILRDKIVCGVHSAKVKKRLLRDNELTLIKALSICLTNEESECRTED